MEVDGNYAAGDAFLVSLDEKGNFRWVKTWGGKDGNIGSSLTLDNSGNVVVTGWGNNEGFQGPFNLPPTPHGYYYCMCVPFDSQGNVPYSPIVVYGDTVRVHTLAFDSQGNFYVCGTADMSIDFSPESGDEYYIGNDLHSIVIKYSASGKFLWYASWGDDQLYQNLDCASDLAVDAGNVYVTGIFMGTADFDPGPGTDTHTAKYKGSYLCKYNKDGVFQWAKTWDTLDWEMNDSDSLASKWRAKIALGPSPWLLVGGRFRGTVDLDPGPEKSIHTSLGTFDAYISLFDTDGYYQKSLTWGNTNLENDVQALEIDSNGNVYVAGNLKHNFDFNEPPLDMDPGPGIHMMDPNTGASYILKLNHYLYFDWVANFGRFGVADFQNIDIDKYGHVFGCGNFYGYCDFDRDRN